MAGRLYVGNGGDDSVSVICLETLKELFRLPLAGGVQGVRRLVCDGGRLYHCDAYSSSVGVLLADAPHVFEVRNVGAYPSDMALHDGRLMVACGESNSLWSLEAHDLTVRICGSVGVFPIALAACQNEIAIAEMLSGTVSVYDANTLGKTASHEVEGMPMAVAFCEESIICGGLTGTGGVLYSFPSGRSNSLFAPVTKLCGGKNAMLAAHAWDDCITLFCPETLSVRCVVKTDKMPDDAVYDAASRRFCVSCMLADAVMVFGENGEFIGSVKVGREPRGLAVG